jgi:transposase
MQQKEGRMPTQYRLPMHPEGAQEVNATLAIHRQGAQVAYFAAGVPVFTHAATDRVGQRVAAVQLVELGLVKRTALAAALGLHRSTLHRCQQKVRAAGVLGVVEAKPGPKGRHKLTAPVLQQAQAHLAQGTSIRATAAALGVSEASLRHALQRGELAEPPAARPAPGLGPRQRSEQDAQRPGGVAVHRALERALAATGQLPEAPPRFEAAEAVRGAGVLCALPALAHFGLLRVAEAVYGRLHHGFYGLRSILLTLAFMALLRVRTPEQLATAAPGEFGRCLGLDRVPEVKTLRRTLQALAAQRQGTAFHRGLAAHWIAQDPDALGFLYVDGHVRPYHGKKHCLPETHVARRRLCLPATTDFFVNDQQAAPVFLVTAPANDPLGRMLRHEILPALRRQLGPDRRVTVIFDREGWSPTLFAELLQAGCDLLTYRKGPSRRWPGKAFTEVTGTVGARQVTYTLAEKRVRLSNGLRLREVRRLTATGHQTAVLTSRTDLSALECAARMFARWQQENFFRYLRHSFALDALVTYAAEPADPRRTVPNPARKQCRRALAEVRRTLAAREQAYGAQALRNPEGRRPTMRGFKIAHGQLAQTIRQLQAKAARLARRLASLPARVPVGELQPPGTVVRLAPEAKLLTDSIKLTAYRAETALLRLLGPHFARTEEEGRALLRAICTTPADLLPDEPAGVLRVRLHSQANPRSNQALAALCEALTATETCFPGTTLRLVYEAPVLHP